MMMLYEDFMKMYEESKKEYKEYKEAEEQSFADFIERNNEAIKNGKFAFDSGADE